MSHGKNNDKNFFELAGSYGAVGNDSLTACPQKQAILILTLLY